MTDYFNTAVPARLGREEREGDGKVIHVPSVWNACPLPPTH